MKTIFYKDLKFEIDDSVYEPREDSYLLAEELEKILHELKKAGKEKLDVLDLGTGCGIQAIICAKHGAKVVATDINPEAVKCAEKNAEKNGFAIRFLEGDLFHALGAPGRRFPAVEASKIKSRPLDLANPQVCDLPSNRSQGLGIAQAPKPPKKFDIIIFNAPYLPEEGEPKEKTIADLAYAGAHKIREFLDQYRRYLKLEGFALVVYSSLTSVKMEGETIAVKKVAFEQIVISKLTLSQESSPAHRRPSARALSELSARRT